MQKSILALTVASLLGGVSFAAAQAEGVQRLPTVTTTDSMSGKLQEERPVGETGRPEWTSARRFSTTRVYLQQDPWEVGVGAWWRYRNKRDNSSISRLTGEIEIGLPYRFQLDFYYDMAVDGDSRSRTEDFAAEVRYALADWGKIPLNPTLYAEYKWVAEGADVVFVEGGEGWGHAARLCGRCAAINQGGAGIFRWHRHFVCDWGRGSPAGMPVSRRPAFGFASVFLRSSFGLSKGHRGHTNGKPKGDGRKTGEIATCARFRPP